MRRARQRAAPPDRHPLRAQRLSTSSAARSACAATRWSASRPTKRWRSAIEFWGDEVERIIEVDPLTGESRWSSATAVEIYPAKHFVTSEREAERRDRAISRPSWRSSVARARATRTSCSRPQRLEQRTNFDLEMLRETGYLLGRRELLAAPGAARRPASRPGRCSTTSRTTSCCSSTSRT